MIGCKLKKQIETIRWFGFGVPLNYPFVLPLWSNLVAIKGNLVDGEFSRSTSATCIDNEGVIQTIPIDTARFEGARWDSVNEVFSEYDDEGNRIASDTLKGLMSYEGATNLFLNSDVPVTQTITVTDATEYTLKVTGTGSITVSGGGSGTATDGSDLTFTTTSTSVTLTVTGDLDRVMFNTGSFAFPHIVTEATTVSTTADIHKQYVSDIITQSKGSIFAEFNCDGANDSATPYIFTLSDETTNNYIGVYGDETTQELILKIVTGGVEQVNISTTGERFTYNVENIVALSYEDDSVKFYVNGVKIGEDTSATIPTGLTTLYVGNLNDNNQLNGTIKDINYTGKILSESELGSSSSFPFSLIVDDEDQVVDSGDRIIDS